MDELLAHLTAWMPQQRWYAAKSANGTGDGQPRLRRLISHHLPSTDPDAHVQIDIIADERTTPVVVYQVPLVVRAAPSARALPGRAIIARTGDGRVLVDGPHDSAYAAALLASLDPQLPRAPSSVLVGEQSNTSIVYTPAAHAPIIGKVFRQLSPGVNPDVELSTALTEAGSPHVPPAIGHSDAAWPDPIDATRTVTGTLAFAQEFLPGVEDAWRVARRAADAGAPFDAAAHALGTATADVHATLASLFPLVPVDDQARHGIAATWWRRLDIAVRELPTLARHRLAIERVYRAALTADWSALQRIHGDFHLGQVLHVPDRGWLLLDFEGEPLRPMAERRRPDLALRDVAGMLRSFDYVSGSLRQEHPDRAPHPLDAWSLNARAAFIAGYESRIGCRIGGELLDALELEKAVYEAIYEARNRPDWVTIPLAAVARLAR